MSGSSNTTLFNSKSDYLKKHISNCDIIKDTHHVPRCDSIECDKHIALSKKFGYTIQNVNSNTNTNTNTNKSSDNNTPSHFRHKSSFIRNRIYSNSCS